MKTNVPVPEVYHFESNPYNELEAEYIIMSKVHVHSLDHCRADTCDITGERCAPDKDASCDGYRRETQTIIKHSISHAYTLQTSIQRYWFPLFIEEPRDTTLRAPNTLRVTTWHSTFT